MAAHSVCDKKSCGECGYIVARTYIELCDQGYGDGDAFISCVDLLELRRPGHERDYYFRCTAQLLGAMADNFKGGSVFRGIEVEHLIELSRICRRKYFIPC